jgi:hypothetical protein
MSHYNMLSWHSSGWAMENQYKISVWMWDLRFSMIKNMDGLLGKEQAKRHQHKRHFFNMIQLPILKIFIVKYHIILY